MPCSLAEELSRKMFVKGKEVKWKYVTKEIMAESARALEVDPEKIKYVFDYQQKSMLDDILSAQFNKYYKSERKIRNTIGKVIRNMAQEGHVIIVGRGGVAITHDIPKVIAYNAGSAHWTGVYCGLRKTTIFPMLRPAKPLLRSTVKERNFGNISRGRIRIIPGSTLHLTAWPSILMKLFRSF